MLLISATSDSSFLSNSNEGDTPSFGKYVGDGAVMSTAQESLSTSGVFLSGRAGCVY